MMKRHLIERVLGLRLFPVAGLFLAMTLLAASVWAGEEYALVRLQNGHKAWARLTGFQLTPKTISALEKDGATIQRDGGGKVVSLLVSGTSIRVNADGIVPRVPKVTSEMFVVLEFVDRDRTLQLAKEIEELLRSKGAYVAATFRKELLEEFRDKDAEQLRQQYLQSQKPKQADPISFSDFTQSSQGLIRSRNSIRNLNEKAKAKFADLNNEDAASATRSLIRSYEKFVKNDVPPVAIESAEFKRTIERGFKQLQGSDRQEPLVLYAYALIRAQLDKRQVSHSQLQALVRNYPHYWNARRALVHSATSEKTYLHGVRELKKFFDEITSTIQAGSHTDEEMKVLLDELLWVVDTAAVFEMKPKTKKDADTILGDPSSKQMIAEAEERLRGALEDRAQRNQEKAEEEAKRISSLIGKAKVAFDAGEKAFKQQWNQTHALFLQANNAFQQANLFYQQAQAVRSQQQANLSRISNLLTSARRRQGDTEDDGERRRVDDEVSRLMADERGARSQVNAALARESFTLGVTQRAFQQRQFQLEVLKRIMLIARQFLFNFTNEFYEAIAKDPELKVKYQLLNHTVYDSRQQLFVLALKEKAKVKPSELLKNESRDVAGLLNFSPHQAIMDLKKELLDPTN
ncbi:MAG: hypothetical protein VB877_19015 [Pirellulaceae bacterium]